MLSWMVGWFGGFMDGWMNVYLGQWVEYNAEALNPQGLKPQDGDYF